MSMNILSFQPDGDTALPCWFANAYNFPDLHNDCVGPTYNAWDERHFMCDCECHKRDSEENAG